MTVLFGASDAGRALRICIGMVVTIAIIIISEMWKRYRYKQSNIDLSNIRKISNSSKYVYSNYAFENRNLFDMNTDSFMMYSQINNNAIVFGDPVGDSKSGKELIWDFKEMTDSKNIIPTFVYLGYKNLKIYDDIGLDIASFGVDANVSLKHFSKQAKELEDVKNYCDNLNKNGYSFEIVDKEQFLENKKYIGFVDYQWEKDFGNVKNKMFDVSVNAANKYVIIKKDNFISGYAYLLLSNTKYEAFVSNVRYTTDCDEKIVQYILFNCVSWAKENEYKWFNLGLTPSDEVIIDDDFNSKAKIFVFAEHFKYDMNALKEFKSKFDPVWKKKYVAFYTGKQMINFLRDFLYVYS
jgi:phosphatidylglycerol lysyltransferase